MALLDRGSDTLPLTTQADLLSLNRSSLYYRSVEPDPEEVAIKNRIDEMYTARPFYGPRRMTAQLKQARLALHAGDGHLGARSGAPYRYPTSPAPGVSVFVERRHAGEPQSCVED